jgi:hypothetical protein
MDLLDDYTAADLPVMAAALSHAKEADVGARLVRQIPASAYPIKDSAALVKAIVSNTKTLVYLEQPLDEVTLTDMFGDQDLTAKSPTELVVRIVDVVSAWARTAHHGTNVLHDAVLADPPVPAGWSPSWGRLSPSAAPFPMAR